MNRKSVCFVAPALLATVTAGLALSCEAVSNLTSIRHTGASICTLLAKLASEAALCTLRAARSDHPQSGEDATGKERALYGTCVSARGQRQLSGVGEGSSALHRVVQQPTCGPGWEHDREAASGDAQAATQKSGFAACGLVRSTLLRSRRWPRRQRAAAMRAQLPSPIADARLGAVRLCRQPCAPLSTPAIVSVCSATTL